jgi:adenine/guanine phosphoribosyltransferase-like PRPP-binding protein
MVFRDRAEAGRRLAERLLHLKGAEPVVLALPRGGVPVALPIAEALGAPLDLLLVRKIGAPWQPELALGAVVEGDPPQTVVNDDIVGEFGVRPGFVAREAARQIDEIGRRRRLWLHGRPAVPPGGRTAVVVDDGIATGATVRAALVGAGAGRRGAARPRRARRAARHRRGAPEAVRRGGVPGRADRSRLRRRVLRRLPPTGRHGGRRAARPGGGRAEGRRLNRGGVRHPSHAARRTADPIGQAFPRPASSVPCRPASNRPEDGRHRFGRAFFLLRCAGGNEGDRERLEPSRAEAGAARRSPGGHPSAVTGSLLFRL